MKWRDPTAQVGLHEMPADGTSPASKAQTGCRLRQTYKDDLWLSINALPKNMEGIRKPNPSAITLPTLQEPIPPALP